MAISKSNQRAVNKYVANHYDRINVTFTKGTKEVIKAAANAAEESVNADYKLGYILAYVQGIAADEDPNVETKKAIEDARNGVGLSKGFSSAGIF